MAHREKRKAKPFRALRKRYKRLLFAHAKGRPAFQTALRNTMHFTRSFRFRFRTQRIRPAENLVFFEAYKGKSYSCSPRAIYEYMVDNPDYQDYQFVWSFKNPKKFKFLSKKHKNTMVIKRYGKIYEFALAMAKYWVINYRLLDHITPKREQICLQCWHGTPMKKLGWSQTMSASPVHSLAERKQKYLYDSRRLTYLLSPSPFATRQFIEAWRLDAIGKTHAILEEGYPRNDALFHFDQAKLDRIKKKIGISSEDSRKIILYAPTWRDDQYERGKGYIYDFILNLEKMKQHLGKDFILLCRLHYLVSNKLNCKGYENFAIDVSRYNDINELYILSDMLITDYSSVCFDYANLKRPMIFFMYDFESYRDEIRGLTMGIEDLPGEIVTDEDQLIQAIQTQEWNLPIDQRYKRFLQTFSPWEDGESTRRVVQRIIKSTC